MTELKPTGQPVRDKSLQNEDTYANIAGRISKNEEFAVKLGHKHNTGDELKLTGEIVRGISHDSEEFYTTITEHNCKTDENNHPSKDCKIHMDQTGFLKCTLAFLVVLCITLGAFLVTLHHKQLSIETRFVELRTNLKRVMTKLNDSYEEMDDGLALFQREQETQEAELEKMKKNYERAKVAFSASLGANGEQRSDVSQVLAYKHVFTNSGNAYNPTTGNFIAPVKGMYFFCFTTFGYGRAPSGAILLKNGHLMVSSYEFASKGDNSDTTGNSIVLQLEAGEKVSMKLWRGGRVHDKQNGLNTFSGFLLFPL